MGWDFCVSGKRKWCSPSRRYVLPGSRNADRVRLLDAPELKFPFPPYDIQVFPHRYRFISQSADHLACFYATIVPRSRVGEDFDLRISDWHGSVLIDGFLFIYSLQGKSLSLICGSLRWLRDQHPVHIDEPAPGTSMNVRRHNAAVPSATKKHSAPEEEQLQKTMPSWMKQAFSHRSSSQQTSLKRHHLQVRFVPCLLLLTCLFMRC